MVDVPLAEPPSGVDAQSWAAACEAVRGYCGWHIAPSVVEKITVDGPGGSLLLLPTLRLTDLTEVTSDGRPVTAPEWSEAGMVRGSWSSRFRGITATITHGYDECPAEVLEIVRDLAKSGGRVGVSSQSSGPHGVVYGMTTASSQAGAVGLSKLQQAALDRYRIPSTP
jgi:hypothetical protein